jgi:predicted RNA-binding protein Jag
VSQAFDSLLAKIENYYSDADYTVQDAEHLSRIAISEYASTQNALVASARHLSTTSVQKIIDQTIDKHITADPSDWMLFAANAVDNVLNYAQRGVLASGLGDFTDFLPVGHPSRTNRGAMTASALNHAIARWTAADPRIASDQARYDTYKAYASKPGSVEADYASFKLSALVAAGYVPEDISLPITAAFRMSFAMRSAMSKALAAVRRRHRDGRFAEEFGRLKGFFSRPDGSIFSEDARIVGAERGTNNFEVEFSGSDEIPDGIYSIDAAKTDSVKAILSERAVKGLKGKRSIAVPTQAERDAAIPLDQFLTTKKDAPEGWTKNEDGSFTSKTGQTLRQVDTRPEGDYMFEGVGESGAEDATKPFFELKDRDGETIGVAQDWAGANKIAMTYDAFEEDSKPEEESPGLDQDAPGLKGPRLNSINDDRAGDPKAAAISDLLSELDSSGALEEAKAMYNGEKTWTDSDQPAIDTYGDEDQDPQWNAEYDKTTKDLIEKIFSDPAVIEARNDMPLPKTQEGEPEDWELDNWHQEVGAAIEWAAKKYAKEESPGLDQDANSFVEHASKKENWKGAKYTSPDGRLEVALEGDVDGNYLDAKLDGKDLNIGDPEYLQSLLDQVLNYPDNRMTPSQVQENLDEIAKMLDEDVRDQDAIGPDLERTDSGDLEYFGDGASAVITKVGDKWELGKGGFLEAEEITGPWSNGQHQYEDTKLFDSEEEAIAEAQKWIDFSRSNDFYDFMYNDWFDNQPDGLDQDAKNPNWFDEAIDFDAIDNQDNWKDLGGGAEQYTSPDGKLKLTFEPDGDSDGAGGIVDASGISVEYDGQSVTSFKATARDLTSPGTIADSLSVALGDANFNPKDLVKANDSGEYEFLSDIGNVGSVSIVKKYDPNTKKLQWEVTKEASDFIDENIEHSYFEQKKFDSLDDARADAEAFAQILNDDNKYSKFLNDDWADRDYDYGFDQASPSVPDSIKQLADGYNISPRVETVYNSNTKQFEREENSSEFESDGDFYDFGSAVVNLSEYAPGKWVATVFYGDNDGSGQNVLELEQTFDSPEEAFEWTANGFGRQSDNSQIAEGVIKRNSSVEMLEFLNSPKFKEIDESYQEEISARLSTLGFDQAAGTDEIKTSEGGNASYKGPDGSTGSIKSDGSGTWEGSFTDAEGEVSTRKFKAEDKAAAWLEKKVEDSKLAAFKKANGGLSPKQLEPATSKQYDLLQELFDERDDIDSTTSDAIKDALDNRNLSKSQISALFGDLQKKPFKPGVDSTKPTDRMLNSLQGYLTTKQISPEELDDILSQLEAGLDRPGIEALTNKLRRKPDNADAAGLDQSAPELSEQEIDQKIDDLASDDDYYGLVEIAQDYDVSEEQSDRALRELERIKDEYDAREASAEENLNAALEASLDEARSDFESAKNDLDVELANGQSDQEEYENQLEELKRELDEFETNYERSTWRGSELGSRSGMLENANGTREAALRAYEDWQSSERADLSGERPGLDQDAPTKPLTEKQLEPASDAQYNYLQSLVESKMNVDADTAAAVAEAATNKNLSKAQAGALIGKLRVLGDKENQGQFGKPSQKMIDSVNRDVYAKGLSEEDRNEILKDLDSLSKGDVSSIISQLKEMPNVPGGLDNYIKALVEDGDLEALKRLRADVRNEDSFSVLDKAINSLETGEDSGLDQAAPSEPATGPLYDKDEAASLLDEIKAAEDAGEIGNTFLPTDTLKDFDSEDIGDAASMYVELDDAIGNVEEGTLRQKLEQFAQKLLSSIQSRLGPVEAAKRDSDDIGSAMELDRTTRRANDLVEFYYPSEGIAFDQLNEPGNNNVGDNRGGGWEARVALDEDAEDESWVASLTSPDGQPNQEKSFDNQEDAARWAAENLESNNNELLPSELDEFLSGQIFSTYADNPQALISKLNDIAEWFRGTRRGDGEDVARGILEYVDRLENLLGDSAPKA